MTDMLHVFPLFPHVETNILHIFHELNDYFYADVVSLCYTAPTSSLCVGCPCVIIHAVFVSYGRTFSEHIPT